MRVHLVCPPASLEPPLVRPRHAPHYTAIVAGGLRDAGHEVSLADQHVKTCSLEAIVSEAEAARPELVLLMHSDYNRKIEESILERVAAALAAALPEVPLWGFGRLDRKHAVSAAEAIPSLHGMLFDEPEFPAVALAALLEAGAAVDSIPGAVLRQGEELSVVEPERVDMDRTPIPAWDLAHPSHYGFSPHQQAEDTVFPVLASRGCPFPCFYCEVRVRPPWRARSVDAVLDELNTLHARYGTRSVFLADPTFAVQRDWALEFCRRLRSEGPRGLRWSCMSRTDRVDPELLQAMADAGCWNILFGIESLNPEALRRASKQLDASTVGPAIRQAQDAGIEVIASIMIGLPGDSPEGVRRTIDELISMEPDFAQFFVLQIPEADAPEGGRIVSEWDGSRYDFWGHVYAPDTFDGHEQLLALRRQAYRRFYLRPRYLRRRLGRMVRSGEAIPQLRRAARGGLLALRLAVGQRPSA